MALPEMEWLLTEAEVARHWRVKPGTLRNARYRGDGLPYVKTATGSIRYRLSDVVSRDKAGLRGFTYEGFAEALAKVKELDRRQRNAVMEAVRAWLRPA
jgi:hypothetical protein